MFQSLINLSSDGNEFWNINICNKKSSIVQPSIFGTVFNDGMWHVNSCTCTELCKNIGNIWQKAGTGEERVFTPYYEAESWLQHQFLWSFINWNIRFIGKITKVDCLSFVVQTPAQCTDRKHQQTFWQVNQTGKEQAFFSFS